MRIQKQKGITLVALVVTIIVLIILATISINIIFGEGGILEKALEGQEAQKMADAREKVQLMLTDYIVEREVNEEKLMDYLLKQKEKGTIEEVTDNEDGTITVQVDGYKVTIIEETLEIEKEVEKTKNTITITLSETSKTIMVEDTFTLTATVAPESVEVLKLEWISGDENIAIVDENGEVIGKNIGETTITAKITDINGKQETGNMKVIVVENPEIIDIKTAEELKKIGQNDAYPLDGRYRLVENIDLEEAAWTPIADFAGEFNGNNKIISNLNVNTTGNIGMFSNLKDNAIVKKLTIEDATIQGGDNAGTLAGIIESASNVTIEDITINVELTANSNTTTYKAGMIGKIIESDNINITNCRVEGKITGEMVGGVLGTIQNSSVIIEKCSSNCIVTTQGASAQYGNEAGFIATIGTDADNNILIKQCFSEGEVIGSSCWQHMGGFVGTIRFGEGKVVLEECYTSTNVNDGNSLTMGGFIGQVTISDSSRNGNVNIKNCYALGNVTGSGIANGGFIGMLQSVNTTGSGTVNFGTIENCYAAGTNSGNGFFGRVYAQTSITPAMTFTNNYWDSTKTTGTNGSYATGKPTTEMQVAEPFTGWDSTVWHFEAGKYPILEWQVEE